MKAMNLCRPLDLSRGTVKCVENILEAPSASWNKRVKDVVQAARQDERQKMLKRFLSERQAWESSRREERKKLQVLQEELKKKDSCNSWLKSALSEREDLISKLKEKNAELERHLDIQLTARLENAQTMKKLLRNQPSMYPGLMQFGRPDIDPFQEVSMDLLRQHKISEQAELNDLQDRLSANGSHKSECSTKILEDEEEDRKMTVSSFMN